MSNAQYLPFGMCIVAGLSFSLAEIKPAADAPQPKSPAESAACIKLPPGFEIELIASEPLIAEPSGIAWDEFGRLFVCELHGYNIEGHIDTLGLNKTGKLDVTVRRIRWEIQGGEIAEKARQQQWGVLKMLTDTDGDGSIDTSVTWADDLPPSYGVVPARGGVVVTCAPDIVYFADHDGDGKPEVRETLYTGFGIHVLERGINNPSWGLDNWIYVGSGGDGGTITGPHLDEAVTLGNSDFRIKADGSAIEPVNGSVGTFGMTMNSVGDRFPSSGGRPAVYALPPPYRYLKRNPYVPTPSTNHTASRYDQGYRISKPHPWRVRRSQDPAWVKFYGKHETTSIYFSGGCSTTYYGDPLFPAIYQENLFYCEPSLNIVHRCLVKRDGAGYVAERAKEERESEFLASTDQWFRPTGLQVGPDGALYIIDMYREIIEDYSAIPRFLQQQYGLDKGKEHGRLWRLHPRGADPTRTHPLAQFTDAELVTMIDHKNAWYRRTAQRLLIERRAKGATNALIAQLHDHKTSPQGLLRGLYTLAGLQVLELQHVTPLIDHKDYRVRLHALRLADPGKSRSRSELQQLMETLANVAMEDTDSSVRLQAVLTLGELKDGFRAKTLGAFANRYGEDKWMDAAILSSCNASDVSNVILSVLRESGPVSLLERLTMTLAGRGDDPSSVLTALPLAEDSSVKAVLMGMNTSSSSLKLEDDARDSLLYLIEKRSSDIQQLALSLASRVEGVNLNALFDQATEAAVNEILPLNERQAALQRLTHAPFSKLATVTVALMTAQNPPTLQTAAITALGHSNDDRVGDVFLGQWASLGPKARPLVLATILKQSNRIPALLQALKENHLRSSDLTEIQREQLSKGSKEAQILLAQGEEGNELKKRLGRYRKALGMPVNLEKGKALFNQTCLICHRLGNQGKDIGPALGSLTTKPDEAILTDILDPSGKIDPEYTLYIINLKQGEVLAGVVSSESPTSLILKQADGSTKTILRQEIASMTSSNLSLMPTNLHTIIAPADASSLIGYLRKAYGVPEKQ